MIGELWVILALSHTGLPAGHDITAHLTYTKLFNQALLEGQFPVRWIEHIWDGHSQPLFNFYQVGFFYFNYLVSFFTPSTTDSLRFGIMILWLTGGVGVLANLRKLGSSAASLAFIIYLLSPYLYLDIFIRSSLPEFMALSLIPLAFFALRKVLLGQLIFTPLLAIIFGVIIFTHLHIAIIFTPIFAAYSLLTRDKNIRFAILAFVLSFGVSAFYLLPAVTELQYIQPDKLVSKSFDFHQNFISFTRLDSYIWGYSGSWLGFNDHWSKYLGVTQWLVWLSSAGLILFKKNLKYKKEMVFWLGVIVYGIFFMSPLSTIIWEEVQVLRYIQFPWRFASVFPMATAFLSAFLVIEITDDLKKRLLLQISVITVAMLTFYPYISVIPTLNLPFFDLPYTQWKLNNQAKVSAYLEPAYFPVGVDELPYSSIGRYYTPSDKAEVKLETSTQTKLNFSTNSPTSFELRVFSHYYPGWIAMIDNRPIEIQKEAKTSYIILTVPEGKHQVDVALIDTPVRKIANRISLITLIVLFIGMVSRILYLCKINGLKGYISSLWGSS